MCAWHSNVKTPVYKGQKYRSGFERDIAKQLNRDSKKVEFSHEYETEWLRYTPDVAWYLPDFILFNEGTGKKIYVEAKGYFDARSRKKMRAVQRANPTLDIRFLFMKNGKVGKTMTYDKWCDRYGFPCAFGEVPIEWMKELGVQDDG